MILWAVTAELLFSTTAKRRNMRSSKWTRKRNCSFHMGFRVLRWIGFVRKWQLSRGIPRTSTSIHGLPVLLLGHTFCPETIWGRKWRSKSLKMKGKQRQPLRLCASPFPSQRNTKDTLEWTRWMITKPANRSSDDWNHGKNVFCLKYSPNYHLSTVKMFKYL